MLRMFFWPAPVGYPSFRCSPEALKLFLRQTWLLSELDSDQTDDQVSHNLDNYVGMNCLLAAPRLEKRGEVFY